LEEKKPDRYEPKPNGKYVGKKQETPRIVDDTAEGEKIVIVIIPVGIPGMGKSTFGETQLKPLLEQQGYSFTSISNDKIRKALMDRYQNENPTKN
jgi:adenylylsulfate kinase-like enzyme